MSDALRELLASFVIEVDKAGELAKGNAGIDALKARLGDLQAEFNKVRAPAERAGKAVKQAMEQAASGFGATPGLAAALEQSKQSAASSLFGQFGAAQGFHEYSAPIGPEPLGAQLGPTRETLDAHIAGAQQFGPTRETLNAGRAAMAESEAAAAKFAGTLRGKLASAVQAVKDGFSGGGGGGGLLQSLTGFGLGVFGLKEAISIVTRLAGAFKQLVDSIGDIKEGAQRLGIATDDFQRLDIVAKQNGTSVDALGTAFRNLSNAAVEPTKQTAEAFAALGVTTKDASGEFKSAKDLFWDTNAALAAVTNETRRNALAQDLLGRSALELKPFFSEGTKAVLEQRAAMAQLPALLGKTIDQADRLSDTWKTVGPRLTKAAEPLIDVVLPVVQWLTDAFDNMTDSVGQFLAESHVFQYIAEIWGTIYLPIQLVWRALKYLVGLMGGQGISTAAKFADIIGRINLAFASLLEFLPLLIDDFQGYLDGKDSVIGRAIKALDGTFSALWGSVKDSAAKAFDSILEKAKAIGPEILAAIVPDWLRNFLPSEGGSGGVPVGAGGSGGSIPMPALPPPNYYGPPTAEGSARGNAPVIGDINVSVTTTPNASADQLVKAGFSRATEERQRLVEAYGGFQ